MTDMLLCAMLQDGIVRDNDDTARPNRDLVITCMPGYTSFGDFDTISPHLNGIVDGLVSTINVKWLSPLFVEVQIRFSRQGLYASTLEFAGTKYMTFRLPNGAEMSIDSVSLVKRHAVLRFRPAN